MQERRFNPYTENGGTILAIAGQDFAVIAGDTRQSEGYNIQTRYAPKVFRLSVRPTSCILTETCLCYRATPLSKVAKRASGTRNPFQWPVACPGLAALLPTVSLTMLTSVTLQNRQGCPRRQRIRRRWQYVRPKGPAASRGQFPYHFSFLISPLFCPDHPTLPMLPIRPSRSCIITVVPTRTQ